MSLEISTDFLLKLKDLFTEYDVDLYVNANGEISACSGCSPSKHQQISVFGVSNDDTIECLINEREAK